MKMNIEQLKKSKERIEKAFEELDAALSEAGFKDSKDPSSRHLNSHLSSIKETVQGRIRDAAYRALDSQ